MTPFENLYYAIGEMAYAVAKIDGTVQQEEKDKFEQIIKTVFQQYNRKLDVSEIIFKLLERDDRDPQLAYDWAINELKVNSHYISPELKTCAKQVVKQIAEAFPPVTKEESALYQRFLKDIEPLMGDPTYYSNPR